MLMELLGSASDVGDKSQLVPLSGELREHPIGLQLEWARGTQLLRVQSFLDPLCGHGSKSRICSEHPNPH